MSFMWGRASQAFKSVKGGIQAARNWSAAKPADAARSAATGADSLSNTGSLVTRTLKDIVRPVATSADEGLGFLQSNMRHFQRFGTSATASWAGFRNAFNRLAGRDNVALELKLYGLQVPVAE